MTALLRDETPSAPSRRKLAKTLLGGRLAVSRALALDPADGTEPRAFACVQPADLLKEAKERIRVRSDARQVAVELRTSVNGAWVQRAFAEALGELIDNAVQASGRGDLVIVWLDKSPEGDLCWQIEDHGTGMSHGVLAGLGRPRPAAWEGCWGLGVALAWAVVEGHGGLLRFETGVGVGTTVSIWLPR